MSNIGLLLIILAGLCWAPTLPAPESDFTGWVAQQLGEWELDPDLLQLTEPTPEEWRQFWTLIQTVLGSDNLEMLAELRPYAEMAFSLLEQQAVKNPYTDWLYQRLDYFVIAESLTASEPLPTSKPTRAVTPTPTLAPVKPAPKPTPPKPNSILPPAHTAKAKKTKPPSRPAVAARTTQDLATWHNRLKTRPMPDNAKKYVDKLKKVFRAENAPEELIWLAEVESSFMPEARSPVGAAGMFQFMPATAERFGLALKPRDERLHPEKSARAAAQYLRILYNQFDSWPLALAAYNAGEGRVRGLLRKHQGQTFDDIAQHLPNETRMYVPKIRALVMLRENKDIEKL